MGASSYTGAVPKTPRLVAACAALLLTAALVTACGGDDGGSKEAADARASSTTSATATLVQQGLDQLAAGDAATAKTTFENVLALDPHNIYGHYNLGVIAQQAGDDQTAMSSYDEALAVDDGFAPALYNKAILTETSDLGAAVELYRRTVAADPTMAAAFMRLGFALVHLGKKDEGATYLGKGVELDPSMADVEAPSYE
jgi:Tfp pilus assembly protein PilF